VRLPRRKHEGRLDRGLRVVFGPAVCHWRSLVPGPLSVISGSFRLWPGSSATARPTSCLPSAAARRSV